MRKSATLGLVCVLLLLSAVAGDTVVYDGTTGELVNGFENWSWANVSLVSTEVVAPESRYSLSVVCDSWKAFYAHSEAAFLVESYASLSFSINGGPTGDEPIIITLLSADKSTGTGVLVSAYTSLTANTWNQVVIPISAFGVAQGTLINAFWIQSNSAVNAGTFYLDKIILVSAPPQPVATVNVVVNIKNNSHPFSHLIFGVNFATAQQFVQNKYTVNRWGGNAVTRYAWDVDAQNHASDWFFENLPNQVANPNDLPNNSSSDQFIRTTLTGKAIPLMTIGTVGYAPIDRQVRCGFSVKKYGAQEKTDQWQPDCGNGVEPDGKTNVVGNNPLDTSRVVDETYAMAWLAHLDKVFGKGTVMHFELDNEPGLWDSTHRDVHPKPMTYDELWNKTQRYATAIKKTYPNSMVFGPVPWGWCEYMFSPADDCTVGPDRNSHGGLPMLQWYIQQIGAFRTRTKQQLVDVIDVHFYPQGKNIAFSKIEDASTAALRFRSTRGLWDPTYVDESWVNTPIYIIPRIQGWINQYAPGLKIAVTEYNFGDDTIITGALTQVIVLGIFARENVYLGARWVVPDSNTVTENAFKLFTNYNGQGASVTGNSVSATSDNDNSVSVFGFSAPHTLYVVLVNRNNAKAPVVADVHSATTTGSGVIYSFSAASHNLAKTGTVTVTNGKFSLDMEAWSAALIVITTVGSHHTSETHN